MVSAAGISMIAIGGIIGPLVSGVLVQHAGWRWCKIKLSSTLSGENLIISTRFLGVLASRWCYHHHHVTAVHPRADNEAPVAKNPSAASQEARFCGLLSVRTSLHHVPYRPQLWRDSLRLELGNCHWSALRLRSHHWLIHWLVYVHARQRSHATKYDEAKGPVDRLLHFSTPRWRNDNDGLLFADMVPGY